MTIFNATLNNNANRPRHKIVLVTLEKLVTISND